MHPQFLVWCLTFGAQFKNDGHYFCRAGGNRPDGLNEPVTASIPDAKPPACSDRSGRAASVAPCPALPASRQKAAGM
ncbi:hypothetical protein FEK92_25675 [Escherichia coli]|nr:hypothetical protein [Escherichia coli]